VIWWPATIKVPDRAGPLVAATEKVTFADPAPDIEPWNVIQGALLALVHEHPFAVLTFTLAVPPEAPTLCDVGCTW